MEQEKEVEKKKYGGYDSTPTSVCQQQQQQQQPQYRFARFQQSPFGSHAPGPTHTPIAAMSLPNGVVMMCTNQRTYEHTGIVTGKSRFNNLLLV